MDPSSPTEELDAVRGLRIAERPAMAAGSATAPLRPSSERCAACGAALASDQRYCVECGQRLARARLPFLDDPVRHASERMPGPARRRGMSVNSTLIAGVGTLLLAMGIGILIGRSSPGSSKGAGPVQVLTVPAAGAGGASAPGELSGAGAAGSASTGSSSSTGSAKAGKGASKAAAKPHLPPAKVVTVGSPGKGRGYQKGHFTGNFFGEGEK